MHRGVKRHGYIYMYVPVENGMGHGGKLWGGRGAPVGYGKDGMYQYRIKV